MSARPDHDLAAALVESLRPLVAELVEREVDERMAAVTSAGWLTVEEAAEQRRTTPAAVRARCERGQLAGAVKDGRRWLVPDLRPAPGTVADPNNRGERRANGPAPGTGGHSSHA